MDNPNVEKAVKLKQILNTTSEPIAIKFLAESPRLEGTLKKMRYCQLLMEAKKGNTYTLTEDNITCPAAAAALGFKPLPDKIRDGDMLQTMGLFKSKQAASKDDAEHDPPKKGVDTGIDSHAPREGEFHPRPRHR